MRKLIEYVRSCFCKHDFELYKIVNLYWAGSKLSCGQVEHYKCRKCGYMKKYKF